MGDILPASKLVRQQFKLLSSLTHSKPRVPFVSLVSFFSLTIPEINELSFLFPTSRNASCYEDKAETETYKYKLIDP